MSGLGGSRRPAGQKYNSRKVGLYTVAQSVKIDRDRKRSIERFVATLIIDEGLKVTLQEAMGTMLDFSMENKEEIVKRLKRIPPLEQDAAWKLLQKPDDWGVADASERIDEVLYW